MKCQEFSCRHYESRQSKITPRTESGFCNLSFRNVNQNSKCWCSRQVIEENIDRKLTDREWFDYSVEMIC